MKNPPKHQKWKLKLILLLFFLNNIILFSQTKIEYLKDKKNDFFIESIDTANFIPFKGIINDGLNNGAYWFKIEVFKNSFLQIENNHITKSTLYHNFEIVDNIPNKRYITYEVFKTNQPVFLKIITDKEAFIKLKILEEDQFVLYEQSQSIYTGLFYGFSLMVLMINVFFFFIFKEKSFIKYASFLFCIILVFSFRDGFIDYLGLSQSGKDFFEPLVHSFAGLTGTFFAIDYLSLNKFYPKFKNSLYIVCVFLFVMDIFYLSTNNYFFSILADTAEYYIFFGCWIVSFFLFKKYDFALTFVIAYFLMTVMSFDFFLAPAWGIPSFYITPNVLKISSYVEMIIITLAVLYRMKVLSDENKDMREEINNYLFKIESLKNKIQNDVTEKTENLLEKSNLSVREFDVLQLIAKDKSNQEIGDELHISVNTVKYHIKNIYDKLNIKSRKEVFSIINRNFNEK